MLSQEHTLYESKCFFLQEEQLQIDISQSPQMSQTCACCLLSLIAKVQKVNSRYWNCTQVEVTQK